MKFLATFPKSTFVKPTEADVFSPGKKDGGSVTESVSLASYSVFAPGGQKTVDITNTNTGSGPVVSDTYVFAPGTGSVIVESYAQSVNDVGGNTADASANVFAPGSQSGVNGVDVTVEAVVGGDGTTEAPLSSSAYAEGNVFAPGNQTGEGGEDGNVGDGIQLTVEARVYGDEDTDDSGVVAAANLFAPGSQSGSGDSAGDGIDVSVKADAADESRTTAEAYAVLFIPGAQTGDDDGGFELDVESFETRADGLAYSEALIFSPGAGDGGDVELDAGDSVYKGEVVFSYFSSEQRDLNISLDANRGLEREIVHSGLSNDWFHSFIA